MSSSIIEPEGEQAPPRVRRRDDGSVATRENSTFSGSNLMSVFSNAGIPGGTSAAELRRGVRNHVMRMTTAVLLRASIAAEPNSNVQPEHLDVALSALHPPAFVVTGRCSSGASAFRFDALGKDEVELYEKFTAKKAQGSENSQDGDYDAAHDSDVEYEEEKPAKKPAKSREAPAKPAREAPAKKKSSHDAPVKKSSHDAPVKKRPAEPREKEAPKKQKVEKPAVSRPAPVVPARALPSAPDRAAMYSLFD